MGKKLIIKGANFSNCAVERVLPSSYDYEAEVRDLASYNIVEGKYYIITSAEPLSSLKLYTSGKWETIEISNGTTVKITDNLYAVYNATKADWEYLTENDTDLGVELNAADVYSYTAPNTFTSAPRSDVRGAKYNVQAGDIVIYRGNGGSSYRLVAVSNASACEYVSQGVTLSKVTGALEVQSDGVLYFNMINSTAVVPLIKILR